MNGTPLIEAQLHRGNLLIVNPAGTFGTVYAAISQPPPAENIQGPRRSSVHDAIDALELHLSTLPPAGECSGCAPQAEPPAESAAPETPGQPSETNPPA